MPLCRRTRLLSSQNVFLFILFWTMLCNYNLAQGDSLELKLTNIAGLTREINNRTEYMVLVHECSPLCTLLGIESLVEMNSAHVLSSEGIRGRFRLSITLRKRTRPPPQQRVDVPVEVVEQENTLLELSEGMKDHSALSYSQTQSKFEAFGRVLITGSDAGEKGNLNHNWRFFDKPVAQFNIDTTVSSVRRCRKSCRFTSDAPFVKKVVENGTSDNPTFQMQLTALRESAIFKGTPRDFLFAGYFAEAAEKSSTEDLLLPFAFPGTKEPNLLSTSTASECLKYHFVAAVGGDIAYVWRLSTSDDTDEHQNRNRLNTGNQEGITVVVFKDIAQSCPFYNDIWGRGELLPTSFASSVPHERFSSFGKSHKGFHTRYNGIAEELKTWLRPGTNVLVTGSFAGGAMATLAFADWLSDSNIDLGLTYGVTFGAPQVGDKLFQRAFRELGRFQPSKASYGFFEQLIAADEQTGRIDMATRFPSNIFENFVPYPGIHSIDCLRAVFPIEKVALSSPGHLRTFRSVGRRRFLYAGRHLGDRTSKTGLVGQKQHTTSNDTLRDLADSFFIIQGDRMSHYMERLTSLYADFEEGVHSRKSLPKSKLHLHVNALENNSTASSSCDAKTIPRPIEKLTLSIDVSSKIPNPHLTLGANLCSSCSPDITFNESHCRPILHTSNRTQLEYDSIPITTSPSQSPLTFVTLRPTGLQTCVQFILYSLHRPHTCDTDILPRELIRVSSAPLLELSEVLVCNLKQRCAMDFDGLRLMIAARKEPLIEPTALKKGLRSGMLTRERGGEESRNEVMGEETGGKEPLRSSESAISTEPTRSTQEEIQKEAVQKLKSAVSTESPLPRQEETENESYGMRRDEAGQKEPVRSPESIISAESALWNQEEIQKEPTKSPESAKSTESRLPREEEMQKEVHGIRKEEAEQNEPFRSPKSAISTEPTQQSQEKKQNSARNQESVMSTEHTLPSQDKVEREAARRLESTTTSSESTLPRQKEERQIESVRSLELTKSPEPTGGGETWAQLSKSEQGSRQSREPVAANELWTTAVADTQASDGKPKGVIASAEATLPTPLLSPSGFNTLTPHEQSQEMMTGTEITFAPPVKLAEGVEKYNANPRYAPFAAGITHPEPLSLSPVSVEQISASPSSHHVMSVQDTMASSAAEKRRKARENAPRLGMTHRSNTAAKTEPFGLDSDRYDGRLRGEREQASQVRQAHLLVADDELPTFSRVADMTRGVVSSCGGDSWCECGKIKTGGCVKVLKEKRGVCSVGACVEWRCGCGSGSTCEKRKGKVWKTVGKVVGGVAKCVEEVGQVLQEMETEGVDR